MRRWLLLMLLAGSVIGAGAQAAEPDLSRLKLRAQTTVYGEDVTFGDVLILTRADAQLTRHIQDQPVIANASVQARTVVTHEQVVRRLDQLGVNLSRVLVSGALRCEVTRKEPAPQTAASGSASGAQGNRAPLLRNPSTPRTGGERTLADVLRAHVNDEFSELGGRAELRFERAGEEFVQLTTPPWEFSVSSSSRDAKLGLREFRVLIRRDGRVQRTVHVFAQVRMTRQVVVAQRPLSVGNFVRREDIAFQTRVFGEGADLGLAHLEEVVGQQVKRFVPNGDLVCASDLKAVDLVQRSRPVTVIGAGSSVQIRLTGIALDSGSYGDAVRVRLGDTRSRRQVLRGVVTGLGTVRIAEGNLR